MLGKVFGWMGLGIGAQEGVRSAQNRYDITPGNILNTAPKIGKFGIKAPKDNVRYPYTSEDG